MYNHDRDSMNEKDFDTMLENSIPDIPPDDVVKEVTPWSKAMSRVIIGIILSTLTLGFSGLNYILPAIGAILCLLGFKALRKENSWFKSCWVIALLKVADLISTLMLNATIWQRTVSTSIMFNILSVLSTLLMLFFLWRGLISVKIKINLPANAGSAAALLIWYIALFIFAILQYVGWFYWIMLIFYVGIIYSLFKLSEELDEAGYAIKPAVVKVPDWAVVAGIISVLVVGITCGYLFFNSYPMDWQPVEETKDLEIERIKEDLIEMGFPENVLNDLLEEDIKDCDGALKVVVDAEDFDELQITGISVKLHREHDEWKVFHHFIWTENPGFYGTEAIQICPEYFTGKGWDFLGDISGHVRYDKDGLCYEAPYYELVKDMYIPRRYGNVNYSGPYAAFSMPDEGENHRGYVSYTITEAGNINNVSQWIDYTHQKSWMQYPVLTAIDNQEYGRWNSNYAFKTIQAFLQYAFYDNKETE